MKDSIGIIGGGLTALTAAKELAESGKHVELFEASNHLGGQIRPYVVTSLDGDPMPIDLGCSFLFGDGLDYQQGQQKNPLVDLLRHLKPPPKLTPLSLIEQGQVYNAQGHPIQHRLHDILRAPFLTKQLERFAHALSDLAGTADPLAPLPTLHAFLETQFPPPRGPDAVEAHRLLKQSFLYQFGCPLHQVSTWNLLCENSFQGQDYFVGNVYSQLIDNLYQSIRKLPNFHCHLRTPVQSISEDIGNHGFNIKSAQGKIVPVSHLICCVPIKTIQEESIQFSPKLSVEKRHAFDTLRFRTLTQSLVTFAKPFWPTLSPGFSILDDQDNAYEYLNLDQLLEKPSHTLLITLYGQRKKDALAPLSTVFGKLPKIVKTQQVDPDNDPYLQGAWPFLGTNATRAHWLELQRPEFDNRLQFAGFAHTEYFGYPGDISGAYLSGQRAAQHILNLDYQSKPMPP